LALITSLAEQGRTFDAHSSVLFTSHRLENCVEREQKEGKWPRKNPL
jgi:hypothetical protein